MTRVLFVDDEPRVLEGLERMLFDVDANWETAFVTSAKDALARLDEEPFDVVVTDMRMPQMDGAALLALVHARHPRLVRIVLSGQTDEEAAVRAAAVAHQFLGKPCPAQQLRDVIERSVEMQALLGDDRLRTLVGSVGKLPSAPSAYVELGQLLEDADVTVEEVAGVIGRDPALSARVLQLVSSAFFTRAAKVTSVRAATLRLGFRTIRNLALSAAVFDSSASVKLPGFDVEALRTSAAKRAALASFICPEASQRDDAMAAALLCDVGQLVLAQGAVDTFAAAVREHRARMRPVHELEQGKSPFTHAEVGAYLLGVWGLPHAVVEAVANHHRPDRVVRAQSVGTAAVVHAAEALLTGALPQDAWIDQMGLRRRWADLELVAKNVRENVAP